MSECPFCRIVAGTLPSQIVTQSEECLAFRDIAPHAPVHVLVIPKVHVSSADELTESNASLVAHMVLLAQQAAEIEGIRESGYRLIMNNGDDALMSVSHLHMHVIGGRQLPGRLA